MRGFAHRQRMQQMGLRREDVLGKPIVAIVNTWSDLSPCHRAHLRERAEAVKRGVLMAGGMPFELPAMSLGEVMVKPTTMLYRNFLAMEVEELLRSLPVDGVVLLAGCDKTTPALVMGAMSMGLPPVLPRRADAQRPPREGRRHAGRRRHAHAHVLGRATRPAASATPNGCSWKRA
jgi:dihydroxyacid dehydratase/phosphogluconate dehydratase